MMAQVERRPAAEIDLISPELLRELQEIREEQTQSEEIAPATEDLAELDLWADLTFFEEETGVPTMQCIKTQKRRDLMMKKHRRAKRKKVLLLKLKAQGKIWEPKITW